MILVSPDIKGKVKLKKMGNVSRFNVKFFFAEYLKAFVFQARMKIC